MSFTEYKTVEREIINNLQSAELGWRYEKGDDVTAKYRGGDESEMLLAPILRMQLRILNSHLVTTDLRADQIIASLRMVRGNEEWLSWLCGEKSVTFDQGDKAQNIRLIDFENVIANDFLCTNQVWIQGAERRRPDILLYVNGIPIVDMEAKTAARGHIDWSEGAKQCARYEREIGQLYASNCFCVAVNELKLKYGVPGARLQYWQQWRDPSPHTHISSFDEMKCSLFGLMDKSNLLDILRNFIVFEVEDGRLIKKVARYQQFRAANKIVERAIAQNTPSNQRRGIVWHTQGSGKSLTMIFAARKLWNHPGLLQPTIIIVVDREQLEEQMAGELYRTGTHNVEIANSRRELRDLLAHDFRGIILTLVHKFDQIEPEMTSRSNVIMLVDEAHRSQYGDLGIFMRSAMPEASMFGLTGTPIELNDRHTPRAFGKLIGPDNFERYMDRYSIADAIHDGATKPIHYDVRLTDWTVAHADLDVKFEHLFAERSLEERKLLLREAKLDAILKHPRRISQVAGDVVQHFVQNVRPNGFKAMFVCRDKESCALYKVALDAELNSALGVDTVPDMTRIVISEDLSLDSAFLKSHYLGSDRKSAIDDFKKSAPRSIADRNRPQNRFRRTEILIVCDMLLTGFDAPILQTMYLDKGMRNHTLLQAIARVNRPYNDLKAYGVILDYFGIFENLNEALNFDKNDLGEVAYPVQQFRVMFQEQIEELLAVFEGIKRDGQHSTLMRALILLNDDDARRETFEALFKNVRILFETIQPDDFLRDYLSDYTWLVKFYMLYRKKFYPHEHFEVTEEDGAKTRALIRQNVDVKELTKDFPSYTLDGNYLTRIADLEPDAKALDIEGLLDAELRIRVDEDEDFRPLGHRLKHIIEQKRAGAFAGISLLRELEDLAKEVVGFVEEEKRPVQDSITNEVRKRLSAIDEGSAHSVASALLGVANKLCFPNWYAQSFMDTELYREFNIVLAKQFRDLHLHGPNNPFVERCIRILKRARFESGAAN